MDPFAVRDLTQNWKFFPCAELIAKLGNIAYLNSCFPPFERKNEKVERLKNSKNIGWSTTLFFFYKNKLYKNIEAQISPQNKNKLRTS